MYNDKSDASCENEAFVIIEKELKFTFQMIYYFGLYVIQASIIYASMYVIQITEPIKRRLKLKVT